MLKSALIAAFGLYAALTIWAAADDKYIAPPYSHDPRIAQTIAIQAERFPPPLGCKVVGGWEDSSIIAYCNYLNNDWYIAHGPDADDTWQSYDGPLMGVWIDRASATDEDPRDIRLEG
jgi:hypothetical protein